MSLFSLCVTFLHYANLRFLTRTTSSIILDGMCNEKKRVTRKKDTYKFNFPLRLNDDDRDRLTKRKKGKNIDENRRKTSKKKK